MFGKRAVYRRLCGNLQVDITKARTLLGWTPPVSVDEGLRRTAVWYLEKQGKGVFCEDPQLKASQVNHILQDPLSFYFNFKDCKKK